MPLAPLTTLKVGGPARFFAEARRADEVREALDFARSRKLPVFVLGGGSNLVVSQAGWPGVVLKVAICGIQHSGEGDRVIFDAGAGEDWDKLAALAVAQKCAGIECLSGIPGSVGGTPVQNVGAYGQEVAETIASVTALERESGREVRFSNAECGFRYRTSIFNTSHRDKYVILRVSYALRPDGASHIEYADLKRYFAGWLRPPTLAETREAVRQIRASKAMLILPGEEDSRSAGSFFKNPVLSAAQFDDVRARATLKNLTVPSYPALEAERKVSAAWLVEYSGFAKGYGSGRVGISRKHALAIVNRGGATAAEIIALKDHIQQRVEDIWGVKLEPEPVFVGFQQNSD